MVISTHTMVDCTSPVDAARLFNASCIDNHNFMPRALPNFVKSVDVLHGESGTVGSIKQINYPERRPYKYTKNRVDEIDVDKFYCKFTAEGDVTLGNIENAVYESTFEPLESGGTHYTMVVHYHTKGDYVVKEDQVAVSKEHMKEMFNITSEYLVTNPHLYALKQ